jgi:transaldolase
VFDDLATAGIDYDDIAAVVEREGVEKFADSFAELIEQVKVKLHGAAAA